MPRTKRLLKENTSENVKPNRTKLARELVNEYVKALDAEMSIKQIGIESESDQVILNIENLLNEHFLQFRQWSNKTMKELEVIKPKEMTTLYERSMKNATISSTRGRKKRSCSVETRATSKSVEKKTRPSRSLSRPKKSVRGGFLTPRNPPPTTYGMVTPKVKPNTPQIVLRRPKHGEMAISMQGSPLMVDHLINNVKPNVNIPLCDGRVFSIQPERGLRPSQIPDIDADLRRQIETLRDNLSKVLADKN